MDYNYTYLVAFFTEWTSLKFAVEFLPLLNSLNPPHQVHQELLVHFLVQLSQSWVVAEKLTSSHPLLAAPLWEKAYFFENNIPVVQNFYSHKIPNLVPFQTSAIVDEDTFHSLVIQL
jgi:hypothetical protein